MNIRITHQGRRPLTLAFAALAVGLLCSQTSAASSHSSADDVSVVVRYDDLDIQSQSGRNVLLKRISRAVDRVCSSTADNDLRLLHTYARCRRESLKKALIQVEQKLVGETTRTEGFDEAA